MILLRAYCVKSCHIKSTYPPKKRIWTKKFLQS
uniref:Uncharacterized protein n=1 Tax=Megaselia scalaris TaxID=36166 RepID=T1H2X6_MEGSC